MKTAMVVTLVLLLTVPLYSKTQPGKSSLAARLNTDMQGAEIAYGKMMSKYSMILFDGDLAFSSGSEETEVGGNTSEGPKTSNISLTLMPEYRTYMAPNARVSPYWGVYLLIGYGQGKTETTVDDETNEVTSSTLKAGAGLGMGVEYFLSNTLSLSAHTRLAQYSFRQEKGESGSGDTAYTHTKNTHTLSLGIAAALFMRIYF